MSTSKPASRRSTVQFLISNLMKWFHTRRFCKPIFRPSGTTTQLKNTVVRDYSIFVRLDFLSPDSFSSDFFYSDYFSSPTALTSACVKVV